VCVCIASAPAVLPEHMYVYVCECECECVCVCLLLCLCVCITSAVLYILGLFSHLSCASFAPCQRLWPMRRRIRACHMIRRISHACVYVCAEYLLRACVPMFPKAHAYVCVCVYIYTHTLMSYIVCVCVWTCYLRRRIHA
jgi:hypothetical protein